MIQKNILKILLDDVEQQNRFQGKRILSVGVSGLVFGASILIAYALIKNPYYVVIAVLFFDLFLSGVFLSHLVDSIGEISADIIKNVSMEKVDILGENIALGKDTLAIQGILFSVMATVGTAMIKLLAKDPCIGEAVTQDHVDSVFAFILANTIFLMLLLLVIPNYIFYSKLAYKFAKKDKDRVDIHQKLSERKNRDDCSESFSENYQSELLIQYTHKNN